jgi:hypothetical protein
MYPETPTVYNDPNADFKKKLRLLVIIAVGAILLFIASLVISHSKSNSGINGQGTVVIVYSPTTITGLSITFDGKQQQLNIPPATYHLSPGNHALKIHAVGYKVFSKTVPVTKGQTVQVNAQLQPVQAITSTTAPNSSTIILPDGLQGSGVTVLDTQYFYNNSWAVLHVDTPADSNVPLILQLDPASGKWQTVAGPAVGFDSDTVGNLPALIQQYLNDNDYVVNGD